MPQYVALLRGIGPTNPDMRNENLRRVFEELGFTNVRTVIASGNVLFETPETDEVKLEAMIELTLPEKLSFSSTTIVRSQAELERLAKRNPFKGIDDTKKTSLNVTFLKHPSKAGPELPYRSPKGLYEVIGGTKRELYSVVDITGKTPDLMTWLERTYTKAITTRTWKTVHRILAKF